MADLKTVGNDAIEKTAYPGVFLAPPILLNIIQQWHSVQLELLHQLPQKISEHCHPYHVVAIYQFEQSGQLQLNVAGQQYVYEVQQDCLLIIPAGLFYHQQWSQPVNVLKLNFHPKCFSQTPLKPTELMRPPCASTSVPRVPQIASVDSVVHHLAQLLKQSLQAEQPYNALYVQSLTAALATHLIDRYTSLRDCSQFCSGFSSDRLNRIVDYIDQSLSEPINLSELAQLLNINQYYFCKLFKKAMGVSPYQYILQRRVERSKQLLKTSSLSIVDVAIECGFANQSHFTRCFHQFTGLTPRAYRTQNSGS